MSELLNQRPQPRSRSTRGLIHRCLLLLVVLLVTLWLSMGAQAQGGPDIEDVELASPEVALTFARIRHGHARTVILVTRYDGGTVEGIDLSVALDRHINDPIVTFHDQGYDGLLRLFKEAPADSRVSAPVRTLVLPVDLLEHHIAAGTNFPAHAGEAGVEGGPFLFSKRVRVTGPYASVSTHGGLLDYEVELAWVLLEDLERGQTVRSMGLLLCNDYTDRETLLQNINVDHVESGDGFTTGKSFEGYLPVGSFFVIPRDYRAFAEGLRLSLWVNGELRQDSPASAAVWGVDDLIEQTWQRQGARWDHRGEEIRLLHARDTINARTMLMSGTPDGTVFAGIGLSQKIRGAARYAFGGWSKSLVDNVIDVYREDAHADGRYLQPGDTVTILVPTMGVIANEVLE